MMMDESSSSSDDEDRGPPPTPPKPPRRAINFYIKANYAATKRMLGAYRRPSDIFRHLSSRWLWITPRARERYETQAREDFERFKSEKSAYERAYSAWARMDNATPPPRAIKRKPDAPRRSKSAYKYFVDANWKRAKKRLAKERRNRRETLNLLRKDWNKTMEKDRKKFEEKRNRDRRRYRREMAAIQRKRASERRKYLRDLGYLKEDDESSEESEESWAEPEIKKRRRGSFCRMQ